MPNKNLSSSIFQHSLELFGANMKMKLYLCFVLLLVVSCLAKHKSKKSAQKRSAKKPIKELLPKKTDKKVKEAKEGVLKKAVDDEFSGDESQEVKEKNKNYSPEDAGGPTGAPPTAPAGGDAGGAPDAGGGAPPAPDAGGAGGGGGPAPQSGGVSAPNNGASFGNNPMMNNMGQGTFGNNNGQYMPNNGMMPNNFQQNQNQNSIVLSPNSCNSNLDECEKTNEKDEKLAYQCYWSWLGCSLEHC